MCSCYVPSRSSGNKGGESVSKKRLFAEKKGDGEEAGSSYNERQGQGQEYYRRNDSGNNSEIVNGPHIEPTSLKSNLKRRTIMEEENQEQAATEKRKVTWPDAHGKDIAHVHEFEPR